MNRYIYRRISAFLIDIFLVTFICTITSSISYMNPFMGDYKEAYDEYRENYQSSSEELIKNPTIENVKKYSKNLGKQVYKMDHAMLFNNLYYLLFYFLYFVVFAYFTDGQTLGKKMFKLRVVNKDGKNASFINLLFRSIFGGSSLFMGVNIIVVIQLLSLLLPHNQIYLYASLIISLISYVIEIIALILLFIKNNRSLDDLVGSTKVIDEVSYV